jgi:alkanesulfonate monooxygenase SsuD/methylene tetrahydromethanopterin reductase-like flavin-dependent oxidoreductase (luciferase family)
MKYGFVQPFGNVKLTAEFAELAEQAGWDGLFVWEPVWGVDAWVSLAAAAARTRRIRLGTMLTPISRMRPWKLASETVALDHLSDGRVTLSVGMGAVDSGFSAFGEVTDRKTRAELLDEGLDILTGLWRGQPFQYAGKHYQVQPTDFMPPPAPIQQPRIPIWVVGMWPYEKSMQRVLRYDGIIPSAFDVVDGQRRARQANRQELAEIKAHVMAHLPDPSRPFDIVVEGATPADRPAEAHAIVQEWEQAGATWWIEALWDTMNAPNGADAVRQRILAGPPAGK